MKKLIIYATKNGCTEKAVKLLQAKLTGATKTVNITRERVSDLSQFDTVILGGPIYVGKIDKALYQFMVLHQGELITKRLGLFICAGEQDYERSQKQLIDSFPKELYDTAIVKDAFGGELDYHKLSFTTKLMLRIVKGITKGYSRLSGEKIEKFAQQLESPNK